MPLLHLEPPHYDGVQSLAVTNNALGADAALFSGSRDSGIKRWDLRNGELKQVRQILTHSQISIIIDMVKHILFRFSP